MNNVSGEGGIAGHVVEDIERLRDRTVVVPPATHEWPRWALYVWPRAAVVANTTEATLAAFMRTEAVTVQALAQKVPTCERLLELSGAAIDPMDAVVVVGAYVHRAAALLKLPAERFMAADVVGETQQNMRMRVVDADQDAGCRALYLNLPSLYPKRQDGASGAGSKSVGMSFLFVHLPFRFVHSSYRSLLSCLRAGAG